MSTAVPPATSLPQGAPASGPAYDARVPGIPFGRLLAVELRKLVDTRSGRWLLIVIVGLSALIIGALAVWGRDALPTWSGWLSLALMPVTMLLPVLGILTMTSEWGQRTALVTFSLEPRRLRVVLAKTVAALLLAAVASLLVAALSAAVVAGLQAAGALDGPDVWRFGWGEAGRHVVEVVVAIAIGLALGLGIAQSAVAIVLYYIAPMVLPPFSMWDKTAAVAQWIDPSRILEPFAAEAMSRPVSSDDWWHAVTAALVWIVLPYAVGCWRTLRREAK